LLTSPYPADRVAAEAQTRLGAYLSAKGFALIVSGPGGLTWRRQLEGKVLAGILCLGLMGIGGVGGGLSDGEAGSVFLGIICGVAALLLLLARRPATVSIGLRPTAAGCEIELRADTNLAEIEALLCSVANASTMTAADQSMHAARSAYFADQIDVDEFESAIADAVDPRH